MSIPRSGGGSPRRTSRWPSVEQETFTRLLKWREPAGLGAEVDAPAEAERLLANRTSGKPPTEGDTPTVVQRRQSPLGALVEKVF